MKIVELNCNQCGASLDVGSTTRFATCQFCGAKLAIHHSESSHFSEVLEAIEKTTDALREDVASLKRQNDIEQLDREWQQEREQYLAKDSDGHTFIPTRSTAVARGLVGGVFGVLWFLLVNWMSLGMNASPEPPRGIVIAVSIFSCLGLFGAGVSIASSRTLVKKAKAYQEAQRRYQARRQELASKEP